MSDNVRYGGVNAWIAWLSAVSFVVYYFSIQTGYSIVNPSLQKDIAISPTQIGLVAAVYTWVYAIGQFFSGAMLDRLGARKVILPAIALVTAGSFIFAHSGSFNSLIVSQVVLALGACAGFVGAGYVGGQWFGPAKFSLMFGLVQFSASVASAFSQNIIAWLLSVFHWQTLFTYSGFLGLALLVIAIFCLKDPKPIAALSGQGVVGLFKDVVSGTFNVAKSGHIWIVAIIGSMVFGSMLSMGVVWAPKLLSVRGMDASLITVSASLIWLGLAMGCVVFARWSDVIKSRKVPILAGIVIQLTALVALLYLTIVNSLMLVGLCFIFGFGAAAHMLCFSSAADVVLPEKIGTASALVNGLMFIAGGILISRPGVRIDRAISGGMQSGIEIADYAAMPLILALMLAVVFTVLMKESYPRKA